MHKHETPHAHNCACHACHGTHGQNHQSRNGSSSSGESPSSDDDGPSQPQLTTIHDHSHDSDLKALKEYTDDVMKEKMRVRKMNASLSVITMNRKYGIR